MNKSDIIGKNFGKLVVLDYDGVVGVGKNKRSKYLAKCVCGNIKSYFRNTLISNKTKSCGCYKTDLCKLNAKNQRKDFKLRQYTKYKNRATYDNLTFELTEEQFVNIVSSVCNYCPSTERLGVDRVDSKRGYTLDNSVPCCTLCNYMKKDLSVTQFLAHIKKIAGKL
jgi:hypothetical protein